MAGGLCSAVVSNASLASLLSEQPVLAYNVSWPSASEAGVCTAFACPSGRRCRENEKGLYPGGCRLGALEPLLNSSSRVLQAIWAHMGEEKEGARRWAHRTHALHSQRKLVLLTASFRHALQSLKLQHLARCLSDVENILWYVVEDAAAPSIEVAQVLTRSGVPYVHLAYGPTRNGGNEQRNLALKHIRDSGVQGIVYNADDDNAYHPLLWSELRQLQPNRVGVLAVRRSANPPAYCNGYFTQRWKVEMQIDRPVYDAEGRFRFFSAGWCRLPSYMTIKRGPRKFCVDMGGFAFDAALLTRLPGEIWEYSRHQGGESELIQKLLGPSGQPSDLQPLANCGLDVLVFHNEFRALPRAMIYPRARC